VDDILVIQSPLGRRVCLVLFWAHHVVLALVPAALHHGAKRGRHRLPPIGLGSFAQYLAFANAYIGVTLCVAALLLGSNLNYSLWPPPLPAAVERMLGGVYYRVTVGLILSFLVGPMMRLGFYPASAAVLDALLLRIDRAKHN
jgi:hypothetical protein